MPMKKLTARPVFEELNHTELWQMAKRIGIAGASPIATREELTRALDQLEHAEVPDPVDSFRDAYSTWLRDNWDRVQMQMPREHCPDCHLSSDMEMADCWLDNGHRVV